jgi:bacitracin synthase 3
MPSFDKAYFTGEKYHQHRAYWETIINCFDPEFIFTERSENAPNKSFSAGELALPKDTSNGILALSKNDQSNIFAVMVSGLVYILYYYTGEKNIQLNIPPLKQTPDGRNLSAFFATDRTCTLQTYLNAVKQELRNSYAYGSYPYEDFYEKERFSSNILVGNKHLHAQSLELSGGYDLVVLVSVVDNRIHFSYCHSRRYSSSFIEQLVGHWSTVLGQYNDLASGIDKYEILTAKEKTKLEKFAFSAMTFPVSDLTIADMFEEQVMKRPNAVFLRYEDTLFTYEEVDRLAQRVANYLILEALVLPGQAVALLLTRTHYQVIGLLGIIKSGGAVLPLDPHCPIERLQFMIQDARAKTLVTQLDYVFDFSDADFSIFSIDAQLDTLPDSIAAKRGSSNEDVAYQIYTSGSTGKPKAVAISNRALTNYLQWLQNTHKIGTEDKTLLVSSIAFDLGYTSLFSAIAFGAVVTILKDTAFFDPLAFHLSLKEDKITYLKITPSHFHLLLDDPELWKESFRNLRLLILGGEPIRFDDLKIFKQLYATTTVINHYGPTETTIGTLTCEISDEHLTRFDDIQVIGKPIANSRAIIINSEKRNLPVGVPGEILISGRGLGEGYINNPVLTSEKYITLHDGIRYYRTGDLGKRLSDGSIAFLGRIDSQVKVNGHRIEVEEIKNMMKEIEGVRDGVVQLIKSNHQMVLSAYYTTSQTVSKEVIHEYLVKKLPHYMVPSQFVELATIPLNRNGKVDYKSLPAIELPSVEIREPKTEKEILMATIWMEVLNKPTISVTANFFEEGGDSIKAIQIASRLYNKGYRTEVKDIFEFPTIAQLASMVELTDRIAYQGRVEGAIPLTPIQEEFLTNRRRRNIHHFNQAVTLTLKQRMEIESLRMIAAEILSHHDALRMNFALSDNIVVQENLRDCAVEVHEYINDRSEADFLKKTGIHLQKGIRIDQDPLIKFALVHLETVDKIIIVAHHLIVDTISWRILLEDMMLLCTQLQRNEPYKLPAKTDSFQTWANTLAKFSQDKALLSQRSYWENFIEAEKSTSSKCDTLDQLTLLSFELDELQTEALLTVIHKPFNTEINDILLSALFLSVKRAMGISSPVVYLESHGRVGIFNEINISRTVGWFTSTYPISFEMKGSENLQSVIIGVKEMLRKVPDNGIGYGVLKYLSRAFAQANDHSSRIKFKFNYFGQVDSFLDNQYFVLADDDIGDTFDPCDINHVDFNISGITSKMRLRMTLKYNSSLNDSLEVNHWWNQYKQCLQEIITFCRNKQTVHTTPSDFTYKQLSIEEVENLFDNH